MSQLENIRQFDFSSPLIQMSRERLEILLGDKLMELGEQKGKKNVIAKINEEIDAIRNELQFRKNTDETMKMVEKMISTSLHF